MTKVCNRCSQTKVLELFAKGKRYTDGRRNICKQCHAEYQKAYIKANPEQYAKSLENGRKTRAQWKRHKITKTAFEILQSKYNGKCHVCQIQKGTQLDHDHACCPTMFSCGKCIRGLLCSNCNTALGLVKDSPIIIQSLLNYIS